MSTQSLTREQAVANALKEISHIATLPEVTLKIVQLVEDPTSTAQDLHNVIAKDPALCTRILKVVNSAFYGLPGQIGSINRAIVLLGLNAVKNISIAASLSKLFKGGQLTPTFSAKDLWMHSVAVATATKALADRMKLGLADEAFLAGLIHDMGVMVEMQYDRNKLVEVIEKVAPPLGVDTTAPTGDMMEAEIAVFGATHQDFGHALCERWKFPKTFSNVTGFHHNPMSLPPENRTLACMVFIADRMAAELGEGFRLDVGDTSIPAEILDLLGLDESDLEAIKAELPSAIEEVRVMLG
jgi:HD-like signal output (HDOD) protein